jgi:hypothetical protein
MWRRKKKGGLRILRAFAGHRVSLPRRDVKRNFQIPLSRSSDSPREIKSVSQSFSPRIPAALVFREGRLLLSPPLEPAPDSPGDNRSATN